MPKSPSLAGWKPVTINPKRQQSRGADVISADPHILETKNADGVFLSKKIRPDATPKSAVKAKQTKLRAVYMRPIKGSDSDAKLVIVDQKNRPVIMQG